MALTEKELAVLLSLLQDEQLEKQTFESLGQALQHNFAKQDHFRVSCALAMLIQQSDLISGPCQRMVALYFLYEMYRTESIHMNPFISIFVHLLVSDFFQNPPEETGGKKPEFAHVIPKLTIHEKYFLTQLLTIPAKDLFKKTPWQVLNLDENSLQIGDAGGIQVSFAERQSEMPQSSRSGIPLIIDDPDLRRPIIGSDAPSPAKAMQQLLATEKAPVEGVFQPEFLRLVPPLHDSDGELAWLIPVEQEEHTLLWDPTLCQSDTAGPEAKRLMARAFKSTLTQQQQQQLLDELSADPKLVYHIGLSPAKLPELVENNPLVAIEVLLKLMQSSQITEYFSVLVNMEMSLHSMEVVNRLTTRLPVTVRMGVTAYGETDIFKIAELADRLMAVTTPIVATVFAEASPSPALLENREEISRLADTITALQASESQRTPRRAAQHRQLCWYHRKFGDTARNCVLPCEKSGNDTSQH
ncbi:hypothetical protein HPB50_004548 [Hyalomma asiaticum]|uniref:Uncharacterized protein n=1 Tax=Hyalomma asiaticum TaxID=266040 RepID=A0ACB7TEF0_HYAAI|nr:hypothetical protein HPB50_004548 [Hyalomma asiaticum]